MAGDARFANTTTPPTPPTGKTLVFIDSTTKRLRSVDDAGTVVDYTPGGDMLASVYDAAAITEQLVGLTATQTLTNKTLTSPTLTTPTITTEATIQNGSNSDFDVFQTGVIALATGRVEGGILTTGAGAVEFSISDGFGFIIDPYTDGDNPTYTKVTWTGLTNITLTTPANLISRIYIDGSGTVVQQLADFTPQQRRNFITLGTIQTADGINVTSAAMFADTAIGTAHTLYDFMDVIGNINMNGNSFSSAGTVLTLDKSAGTSFVKSVNLSIDEKNPNQKTDASISGVTWFYAHQDGSGGITLIPSQTDVDPDQVDDGTGTLAALANNKWTNQRIFFFPVTSITVIQYGQTVYSSQADAEADIDSEDFVIIDPLNGESLRTTITVKKGTTDLTSSTTVFTNTGKFGFGVGNSSAGGTGTQDLQATYDLSVTPEIVTDTTRGALTIKRGTALDTDDVFDILNGSDVMTFAIKGNGEMTTGAITLPITDGTVGQAMTTDGSGNVDFTSVMSFPEFQFYADQFDNPINSDWTVNSLAPAAADSNNNGITVRLFDDTTEEGVGFSILVPSGATNIVLNTISRAETGPTGAQTVARSLYNRGIPNNAAVQSWSAATDLTDVSMPTTTEFFQDDTQTIALSTLSITAGEVTQFEMTRDTADAGDTLTGDWALLLLKVSFT